jgi:hypothetical protein
MKARTCLTAAMPLTLLLLDTSTSTLRAGSEERSAQLTVSPGVLDFGGVGVGRTKDLTLVISNAGGSRLEGTAAATGPFSVVGETYSLKPGQSKSLRVRYKPAAPGTNTGAVTLAGGAGAQVPAKGWAGQPPAPPRNLRVVTAADVEQADFIVHYFDDRTSYLLKPASTDRIGGHGFYAVCQRADVLERAAARPGRELAIVSLIHYPTLASEQPVKLAWANDLQSLGYKRVLFCRADRIKVDRIVGLPVLDGPQATKLSAVEQAGAQLPAGGIEPSLPVPARPGGSESP